MAAKLFRTRVGTVETARRAGEDVIDLGRTEGAELDFVVTGSIAQSEGATSVRLELWDIERGEAIDSLAKETVAEDAGTALLDLGQQLVDLSKPQLVDDSR